MLELIVVVIGAFLLVRAIQRLTGRSGIDYGPVGWCAGTRWRTLAPLARVSARRLCAHPAFLVGVAVTPLMLWAATSAEPWHVTSTQIALALVPLAWFTIVAANLIVLRPTRTSTAELLATLPTAQPVRTAGMLLAAWVPATAAVLLAAGWVAVLHHRALSGTPDWGEIGTGVAIVVGGVAVGIAVGRWLPSATFGVVAVVAVIVLQARFLDVTTWPWNRTQADQRRFLAFFAEPTSVGDPALEIRPTGWHLVYLVGLTILVAAVALARDGVPRRLVVGIAAAIGVVGVAGWVQTRPPTERAAAAMVSYLTEPARHQHCERRGQVEYCAYPPSVDRIDDWQARIDGVLGLVPDAVSSRGLQVVQRAPVTIGDSDCGPQEYVDALPASVSERLNPQSVWPDDGLVHPDLGNGSLPCSDRDLHELFTAVQAGAWSVGLPPAPHHDDRRCTADGQARAVVALWLGAAATPGGADLLDAVVAEGASGPRLTFDGWNNPPMWGAVYSTADATMAVALAGLPAAGVADALHDNWDHWVDPATTSGELAAAFDLAEPPVASSSSASCR